MIYSWQCDRRQFVELASTGFRMRPGSSRSEEQLDFVSLRPEEMVLVWPDAPTAHRVLPRVVIVSEGGVQDFLAWVSTYFRQVRPFTGHCRVLTPTLARLARKGGTAKETDDLPPIDLGLTIAEAAANGGSRTDPGRLSFAAVSRTLSYSLATFTNRYGPAFASDAAVLDQVARGWATARDASSRSGPLDLTPIAVREVWRTVLASLSGRPTEDEQFEADPLIVDALRGIQRSGEIPEATWRRLFGPSDVLHQMNGPREERVSLVDFVIRELSAGDAATDRQRAFLAGYLASRIQPGTLDHFAVLLSGSSALRESLLWYGVCASLHPETQIQNFGDGLGWLIKREVSRASTWLDSPDCDLSLPELLMLVRNGEASRFNLKAVDSTTLRIEVFPLVPALIKVAPSVGDGVDRTGSPQSNLFDEAPELRREIADLLAKLDASSRGIESVRRRVEGLLGQQPRNSTKRGKK